MCSFPHKFNKGFKVDKTSLTLNVFFRNSPRSLPNTKYFERLYEQPLSEVWFIENEMQVLKKILREEQTQKYTIKFTI